MELDFPNAMLRNGDQVSRDRHDEASVRNEYQALPLLPAAADVRHWFDAGGLCRRIGTARQR